MFSNIIFESALSEEDCDTIVKECERRFIELTAIIKDRTTPESDA